MRYSASFLAVSVSAAQDLVSILAGTGVPVKILRVSLSAEGVTTAADMRLAFKRLRGTITAGTGGTVATAVEVNSSGGTLAASSTCRANDTTRASVTGTNEIVWNGTMQQLNNLDDIFVPELDILIAPGQEFVFGLEAAPGAATTMSATVMFEEVK